MILGKEIKKLTLAVGLQCLLVSRGVKREKIVPVLQSPIRTRLVSATTAAVVWKYWYVPESSKLGGLDE